MAGVRRSLMNLFHHANSNEPRREAPVLPDFIIAQDSEPFEPRLVRYRTETMRDGVWAARLASAIAGHHEAGDRGVRLLKENLSPAQRAQYEECSYFDVIGGETGRRYRISNGCQMNVHQLDKKGRPVCLLCFMPKGKLVVGDVMLAQKLALELFEAETLKVANTFTVDHPLFNLIP